MALGLVVALLAVTMPATAIAPISESSYAETRLWTFEHQDPAGSRAERGLSRTGIEGYQLSSWKPRRAVPFTRGGQQVALHNYFPFGQEATSAEADEIQLKFTGHERDKTGTGSRSELDYMHARHCSPVVGRFLSVDPSLGSRSSPQSWNRFSYVSNSPINQVDPDGRLGFLVTAFLGGVVDVGIQIASNALSGEELTTGVAGAFVTGAVAGATGLGLLKVAGRGAKLVGAVRNAKKLKKSAAAADAARAGAKGAAEVSQKVANQANHIFGSKNLAKHRLGGVLDAFGGDQVAALRSIESSAQKLAASGAIEGVFRAVVRVGEHSVTVKGRVIDGVVNVGSAFIPIR